MPKPNLAIPRGAIAIALCKKLQNDSEAEIYALAGFEAMLDADSDICVPLSENAGASNTAAMIFMPVPPGNRSSEAREKSGYIMINEDSATFCSGLLRKFEQKVARFYYPPAATSQETMLIIWGSQSKMLAAESDKKISWDLLESNYYPLRALKELYWREKE